MSPLETKTVRELRALATEAGIVGRSTMRKDELIAAIEALPLRPGSLIRGDGRQSRWKHLIDQRTRCGARLPTSALCDLPIVTGENRCVLHGGMDIGNLSIPAFGELGPHTWPALRRHQRMASYDPDVLGADPVATEIMWWLLNYLYHDWFKVEVEGIINVPMNGPGILVPNHAGAALPYDAMMLQLAVANEAALPRRVRVIGTEIFNMLPFVSHLYRRAGGAFAGRSEAAWALGQGHLLGVFPEGVAGFQKATTGTYQTVRFGRGGFAGLAAAHGAPVIPVAIIGSEETHPVLFTSRRLADFVRLIFPEQRVEEMAVWLNPIPLPVRWTIRFLPPIHVPTDADRLTILEAAEETRRAVQTALDEIVARRS
jgi:1-acyl-sn-glycerol-3-phosphate acyltransferase